jgi:N-alpha-acetyltransferase 50
VDIKFGDLNDKNLEQFRILNYVNLPVIYSEDFYRRLTAYTRYSKLAYLKDILVGAISCKEDTQDDGSKAVYIMTITVLKPYRRFGIASQLLEQAIQDCAKSRAIKKMTLHV